MRLIVTTCQYCPNPTRHGDPTCHYHSPQSKGTCHIKCQICHTPQRDHQPGYPEHTTQTRTPPNLIHNKR